MDEHSTFYKRLVEMSTTRDKLYQHFGPILIEALAEILIEEINILREKLNLQPRTKQQLINALKAKNDILPPYDWMKEEPPE